MCFLGLTTVFTISKVFYFCFSNSVDNRRSQIVNNKRCLVPKLQYRCHSRFHFDTILVAAILQPFSVYKGTISKKALASHKIGFIFHENTKYWKKKQALIHTSTFSNFLDFKCLLIQKNHASNIKSIFDNSQGINSLPHKCSSGFDLWYCRDVVTYVVFTFPLLKNAVLKC